MVQLQKVLLHGIPTSTAETFSEVKTGNQRRNALLGPFFRSRKELGLVGLE